MAEELKACRNCGGKCDPKGWMRGDGLQGPECEGCGITTPDVESWNRLMGAQLPSQGGEAVEVVASIAVDAEGVVRDFTLEPGLDRHPGGYTVTPLMTVAQHQRILAASAAPALTVWCGPMPESNGKSNFTVVLMRKGADLFDGLTGGITIKRSEYPDRVQYEADRMRYLIGELDAEPDILAYDPDKHSGYTHPAEQVAEGVVVSRELLERAAHWLEMHSSGGGSTEGFCAEELRALLAKP